MERKASIKLLMMKDKDDFFNGFRLLGKKEYITKEYYEFDVPIDKFNGTNNCLTCELELFKNEIISKNFIINIYICLNIFHLYLSEYGYTFEIIFLDELDFKESPTLDTGFEYDDNDNKHRKRVSLINYSSISIKFNNFTFTPYNYISSINLGVTNSLQFSIYSRSMIIVKANELFDSSINIKDFYNSYKDSINDLYNKLIEFSNKDVFDKKKLELIVRDVVPINNKFIRMNFCKSIKDIENSFDDKAYIEYFYQFLILKLILKLKLQIKDQQHLKNILTKYNDFKVNIVLDKDLATYQKIFGLIQAEYIMRKYNCYSISYIKIKYCDENSILGQSITFFKEFINNLDEESPVFFKLLEINSKFGYYTDTPIYNFNLLNVDDIKNHLIELIPEIIFFFNAETKTKAFSFSMTGQIAINEKYLFNQYERMDLIHNYNENKKENAQNLSMTLSRYIIHEDCGHTKFKNKSNINNKNTSPIKCVVKGAIKQLTYIYDNNNSDDLIKIFPGKKNGRGDSGHYLETAFGQYNGTYTISYFDRIKNVGKLINFPEYFIKKDKIKILEKYMFNLFLCENNNFEINHDSYETLEEGISVMSNLLSAEPGKVILQSYGNINKGIFSSKEPKKIHSESCEIKFEELNPESSITEENILKDFESCNDSEEQKDDFKFLSKKRKKKMDNQNLSNEEKIEANNAKNIKPKISIKDYKENDDGKYKFPIELFYEYYSESDDDEACI
jgi:hypothetical protein